MPAATVMIATRNRKEEVCRAVASALAQTADVEVIVTDDASTDGTAAAISERHPQVRLITSPTVRGSLHHRNAMARSAAGPVLISLDDDAELLSEHTVAQVLAEFDHPRIAAVGIPFFDAPRPTRLEHRSPPVEGTVLTDYFLGCCAALHRDRFNAVGGYDETLRHSGEEVDICARWLARGWVVRLGSSDLAVHHVSPRRSSAFAVQYATRNEWRNAFAHLPPAALARELGRLSLIGVLRGMRRREPGAVAAGIASALRDRPARDPLPPELAALWHRFAVERRRGARTTTMDAVEELLTRSTGPA